MAGFGEIFPVAKILTEVPPHDRPIVCLLTVYTVLALSDRFVQLALKVIEMNERFGMKLIRLVLVAVAVVAIVSRAVVRLAISSYDNELPDYQRAPTPTGNLRYDNPRVVDDIAQDYGQDYQDEPLTTGRTSPARYETINRVRPAYQQSNRPLPAANARRGQ